VGKETVAEWGPCVPEMLHSVGFMAASAPTGDVEEFVTELRRVPEGWAAVAGIAILLAVGWAVVRMYRHEGRRGASLRARMVLAALRCLVLAALAFILLEPVRVRVLRRWVDSYTLLLVDNSSSMDLADTYRDAEAADRVANLLGTTAPAPVRRGALATEILDRESRTFLTGLAESNRVQLYTFSDEPKLQGNIVAATDAPGPQTQAVADDERSWRVADAPTTFPSTGPATNIERAVRRTVESLNGAPVAAVVVLTDGGFNQGASAEEVARYARERHVPIHVIGIGDPASPRNVRVSEVLAPQYAFRHDPFPVSAWFATQGVAGESVRVQLLEQSAEGGEARSVESRDLAVGEGGVLGPVTFQRHQERAGRYLYTINAVALPSESIADDNSRQLAVQVIDARTRVLLIGGGPSWDYQFVTRLLEADETFDVSCWLQTADGAAVRDGDTIIDHLPERPEELFVYDVVVLMDPDQTEIDEPWARLIETFVTEHGGGLLLTAGRPRTPEFLREAALRPLHELLPVTLDPEADLVLNTIGHYQQAGFPCEIPDSSLGHPVLRLADDPASTKLAWQGIGDIHWHYPVLREKPAATVLLRHGGPRMRNSFGGHILAAVQFAGAGRTGFVAFDGTYRWRRSAETVFNRFWIQLVRYLAESKQLGGAKRGTLLTDSDEFSLGEAVTVRARLFDARYEPLDRAEAIAKYQVADQVGELPLAAVGDRPGWFEGRFVPDRIGAYRISLTVPGAGEANEIARDIRIIRPNIEILRPQMDRAALAVLAEQSAGGRYFEVDRAGDLPGIIPDLHEEVPVRSRPTALWDRASVLVLLISLLALEWAGRKWRHLL